MGALLAGYIFSQDITITLQSSYFPRHRRSLCRRQFSSTRVLDAHWSRGRRAVRRSYPTAADQAVSAPIVGRRHGRLSHVSFPAPSPLVPQHCGILVHLVLVFEQLSIRRFVVWWCYPFPGHHARQSQANTCSPVEPAGCGFRR